MSSNESFLKIASYWSKVIREMDAEPVAVEAAPVSVPAVPTIVLRCAECGARDQTVGSPCAYCGNVVV